LHFDFTVNLADGRQSLVVVPDLAKLPNKKAQIHLQMVEVFGQLPVAGQVSPGIVSPYEGDLRGLSRDAATDTASTTPIMPNVIVVGIST
jgi:hypothetical protein